MAVVKIEHPGKLLTTETFECSESEAEFIASLLRDDNVAEAMEQVVCQCPNGPHDRFGEPGCYYAEAE